MNIRSFVLSMRIPNRNGKSVSTIESSIISRWKISSILKIDKFIYLFSSFLLYTIQLYINLYDVIVIQYLDRRLLYMSIYASFDHVKRVYVCIVHFLFLHYKISIKNRCMKDEGRKSHGYSLSYLTIYASFVDVKELTNKSSFISFHTLN